MVLSELPNPYDPHNPISDPNLFVGRTKEMSEIKYYLGHASKAAHPINLAILGPRSSGKTSVLNMIQFEAKKKEFPVTTRIELDEGDVQTQLMFFYKIFDSILTTACFQGAFEGIKGRTYTIYRDMVDAYEVPEDKTFCPFVFPIQYAKTMNRGNINTPLSETSFKRDLENIREELRSPVIVLFDECDVLTKSRVHLEKLRNIFMNVPGFMLVMTGSPALFPLMNEVFSPIIRQFRKIYLEPFKEEKDTENCIRRPLEKIEATHPSELFDFETYRDVREVHNISGGRPYEIQLLCHIMFRRVQEGRTKRMEITLDTLDEVRKELEAFQDVPARHILTAIRNLDEEQLSALSLLCNCSEYATFEQVWFGEFIFRGEERWTKEALLQKLHFLQEEQVIAIQDDIISFAGDDFDRLYTKYFARTRDIFLLSSGIPFEIFLIIRLGSFLKAEQEEIEPMPVFIVGSAKEPTIQEVAMMLKEEGKERNPFKSMPDDAQEVYKKMITFRGTDKFQAARVTLASPRVTVQQWFTWRNVEAAERCSLSIIQSLLSEVKTRTQAIGGDLNVEVYELPVMPVEMLAEKVEVSENTKVKQELSDWHSLEMYRIYEKHHRIEEAIFHGELAYEYHPRPWISNNLGYLFMVSDDLNNLNEAKRLLEKAIKDYKEPKDQALPIYNLGIVEAKEGRFENALDKFKLAINKIETAEKREKMCACLILPKVADRQLIFEEVIEPDLLETARSAVTAVSKLLNNE